MVWCVVTWVSSNKSGRWSLVGSFYWIAWTHLSIEQFLFFFFALVTLFFYLASNNWRCNCGMSHWKMIPSQTGWKKNHPQTKHIYKLYGIKIRSYKTLCGQHVPEPLEIPTFGTNTRRHTHTLRDKTNLFRVSLSLAFSSIQHIETKPKPMLKPYSKSCFIYQSHCYRMSWYKPHQFIFPAFHHFAWFWALGTQSYESARAHNPPTHLPQTCSMQWLNVTDAMSINI